MEDFGVFPKSEPKNEDNVFSVVYEDSDLVVVLSDDEYDKHSKKMDDGKMNVFLTLIDDGVAISSLSLSPKFKGDQDKELAKTRSICHDSSRDIHHILKNNTGKPNHELLSMVAICIKTYGTLNKAKYHDTSLYRGVVHA